MTALPGRRRRSTLLAAGAAVAATAIAAGLVVLGAVTLYNSTEGADASSGRPELVFPATPTGVLAAVDDTGHLASLAVLVVQPSGTGGSIVTVPVNADASGGRGDERLPIGETMALQGPDSLQHEVEVLLGLTIDELEVVDAERLAELLAVVNPLEVDLPVAATDADGAVVAEAGPATLDADEAAAVLTARDPAVPAAESYLATGAVWSAVAAAMGEGVDAAPASTAGEGAAVAGIFADLAGGPVGHRALRTLEVADDRNPRGVDVVLLDEAELALVFGQIAPGKVAAPNPALSIRLESSFTDDELDGRGLTNTQAAYRAVSAIQFVGGNVLSVDTAAGPVGKQTVIEVADQTLIAGTEGAEVLFGPLDVRVAEARIVGVDAVVRLGTNYLDFLAAGGGEPPATTPPTSAPPATDDTGAG